jgi:hypothetical protein
MAVCNPLFLSPNYNENGSLSMPNTRIRSFLFGLEGKSDEEWGYRFIGSYSRHWGSYVEPLADIENVSSAMLEVSYNPLNLRGYQFLGSIAADYSNLIGNNWGVMITIIKSGVLSK